MTNLEKQRIKQACNLTSLILTSLPLVLEFKKDEPNLGKRLWEQGTNLSLFIYGSSYYTLNSIFWHYLFKSQCFTTLSPEPYQLLIEYF